MGYGTPDVNVMGCRFTHTLGGSRQARYHCARQACRPHARQIIKCTQATQGSIAGILQASNTFSISHYDYEKGGFVDRALIISAKHFLRFHLRVIREHHRLLIRGMGV